MFRRLLTTVIALLALGAGTAFAQGRDDQWVLIGTRLVDLKLDHDRIDVTTAKGRYKAIRLVAKRRGILISRVSVTYGNCSVHNEVRRINLETGERTRPIDLRGEERFVDHIDLVYQTEPGTLIPATVEVWGLQSPGGAAAARPPRVQCPPAGGGPVVVAPPKGPAPGPVATGPVPGKADGAPPAAAAPGSVTAGGDVLFGIQYAGFGKDRDSITVGAQYGKFDKIRLRVLDNDIHITEMKVVYSNGEPDTLAVNADVKANTRTRWFTLKGDRFVSRIDFNYKSRPNFKGQARVEVYGEYAEGWSAPAGPGVQFNKGWIYLGGQSPLFFSIRKGLGYETDVISVGRNSGGFKELRLDVKDRAITLNQLTVVYRDGTESIIPVKAEVKGGSSYGPVPLMQKAIKEIRVSYRSRFLDKSAKGKGYSFVEFWARH